MLRFHLLTVVIIRGAAAEMVSHLSDAVGPMVLLQFG